MRFLITRPKPDADKLARQLEQRGHTSLLSPVMKLVWHEVPPPLPSQIGGVVVTSRNALRSLEQFNTLSPLTSLPLFAVGESTAAAAKRRGFTQIHQAAGRAETLPPLINAHQKSLNNLPLYHPGSKQKAFDLTPALQEFGIELIEQTVYETQSIDRLAPEVLKALNTATIDGILLLSPRTASLFAELVQAHKLHPHLSSVTCLCLSQNVARKVDGLNWRKKLIAARPDIDNLLDLMGQIS